MKKYTVLFALCLAVLGFGSAVYAQQGGFTGPSAPGTPGGQMGYQNVTVGQLQTLPNNKAYVVLTGNITQSLRGKYYTFRDATGEITIEIDSQYWWNVTVSPSDRVEVLVKFERKRNGRVEVEGKGIRKI